MKISAMMKKAAIVAAAKESAKQYSYRMPIAGHGMASCWITLAHRPGGKTLWRVSFSLNGTRIAAAKLDALA